MNRHQQALALRRRELVDRSAMQRGALVGSVEPLVHKAAALDRIVGAVRRHPLVTGLGVALVALAGSRKLFQMGSRLLTLYMLFRR
ncbi:MAG: hypothetical protein E6H57_07525 [Betaproteobacteria bacterium]|nr:MAG: hypothetical protein E6H57_07525 [Betaproteobacteria bacterium]